MNAASRYDHSHLMATLRRHYREGDSKLVPLIDSFKSGEQPTDADFEIAIHVVVYSIRTVLDMIAANGGRTIYSRLVPMIPTVTINLGITQDRSALGEVLGNISRQTFGTSGILLSVIVGKADDWTPSKGFSSIAIELGKLKDGDSFIRFYVDELAAVHAFYSTERP